MRIPNLLVAVAFLITIGLSTIAQAAPPGPRPPSSRRVPEIDQAAAAGALAMLAGGALMIRSRRR